MRELGELWFRFQRDERGGAMAEAVIVLPAFILVWSLILFVHNGYENAANASVQVRRAAWAHSLAGCEGDAEVDTDKGRLAASGGTALSALLGGGSGWLDLGLYQPLGSAWFATMLVPVGFNTYKESDTIERPTVLGGSARFGHQLPLACDEQPRERRVPALISASWLVVLGEVVGG